MMTSQVLPKPADNDWHGRVRAQYDEKKSSVLDISIIMDREKDAEAGNCNTNGNDGKEEAMLESIAQEGHYHCKAKCSCPAISSRLATPRIIGSGAHGGTECSWV
jgi:hypothetical protein